MLKPIEQAHAAILKQYDIAIAALADSPRVQSNGRDVFIPTGDSMTHYDFGRAIGLRIAADIALNGTICGDFRAGTPTQVLRDVYNAIIAYRARGA